MERNWFLLCVIALASATLLTLGIVINLIGFVILSAGLSHVNDRPMILGNGVVALLVAIVGPVILAKRYSVGFWWGVFGVLLSFATLSIYVLPPVAAFVLPYPSSSYVSWGPFWVVLGPIVYLVVFGVLYFKRRRHSANLLKRFD